MNNKSLSSVNNETFAGCKESILSDNSNIQSNNLTKISDVSREFRE